MMQILEHLFSNLTSGVVTKPCNFSLIFLKIEFGAAIECLVQAYIATLIASKTLLFNGPINNRISHAHGIDNKLNETVHNLSPYLHKKSLKPNFLAQK